MLELLCPHCRDEEDSFYQYGAQSVTITVSNTETIDDYTLDGVEIDQDALLGCNNCGTETLLNTLRDTATAFLEERADGEEVQITPSPSPAPSPSSTAWEQVKPSKEASV